MTQGHWLAAIGATLLVQMVASYLNASVLVSAPFLTQAAGVPVEQIGFFSTISIIGSMWYLMACGPLLPRFGALRMLQVGLIVGGAGLIFVLAGEWVLLLLAGLLSGIGYGPMPPASSDILARHIPAGRRALAFSIKQAGVPLGNSLAGIIVPLLAVTFDWRLAIALAVALAVLSALAVEPLRRRLDAVADRSVPVALARIFSLRTFIHPFRGVVLARNLPLLSYVGFCFASSQSAFVSFYVPYLTSDLGLTITAAGLAFAVKQVAGAIGRVVAGGIADLVGGLVTLLLLAGASAAALMLTALLNGGLPSLVILASAALAGFAAISWNGVYLSEVARIVPPDRVAEATSGSTFFTFIGYGAGPSSFALIVKSTGSYQLAFLAVAALPLSALLALWKIRRDASTGPNG